MLIGHNRWSKDSQLQTVTVWIQGGKRTDTFEVSWSGSGGESREGQWKSRPVVE